MIPLTPKITNDISSRVTNFQYLVELGTGDEQILISTEKQMFETENGHSYYEDLDLKVSTISEKIDLKTKKIQLSGINVTLTNFLVDGLRLSDRLLNPIGRNIKIYLKTQSCKTLEDCIQIANLKITRYDHDDKAVKINADDINLESFYVDLPRSKYELKKDVNTFEHYDNKMIPMLYGHLKNAPAVVYYEEGTDYIAENGIRLLCDSAYLDSNIDIEGIKPFERMQSDGTTYKDYDLSENLDVVSVKMGDRLYQVHCLPFYNTSVEATSSGGTLVHGISNYHYFPQWKSYLDYVKIYTRFSSGFLPPAGEGALWVHAITNSTSQKALTYTYTTAGNWYLDNHSDGIHMDKLESLHTPPNNQDLSDAYSLGVQSFDFENNVSDIDRYILNEDTDNERSMPFDVHFLGNMDLTITKADNHTHTSNTLRIYAVYSPYKHDVANTTATSNNNKTGETDIFEISGHWSSDFASNAQDFIDPWARNKFVLNTLGTAFGENSEPEDSDTPLHQYLTYFGSFQYGQGTSISDYNNFISRYTTHIEDNYPILDATKLVLYYSIHQPDSNDSTVPKETVDLSADWENVKLRKTWINKDMWEKDFFVNARGRTGADDVGINSITGEIRVYNGGIYGDNYNQAFDLWYESKHLTELYKYLTDDGLQTKYIDGEVYQIMIQNRDESQNTKYLYDIDITGIYGYTDMSPEWSELIPVIPDIEGNDDSINHTTGWVLNFKSKNLGGLFGGEVDWYLLGFDLVYGKKVYDENQVLQSIETIESPELDEFNNSNLYVPDIDGVRGYCYVHSKDEDIIPAKKLIEKPSEIIKHIIENEMVESNAQLDGGKYANAFLSDQDNKFAFSINEVENSKDIIEKICEQSRLMFRYRPRDGMGILDTIQDTYGDTDVDYTVITSNMLGYSYTKSKIEDLCIGGCRVKYNYNYGTEELSKTTDDARLELDEVTLNSYKDYYGITDIENYEVEIEAPYIQDTATAIRLRNFIFKQRLNQHLIIKFSMSIKEGLQLEVGDVIRFDDNPRGIKPYGIDITTTQTPLNQMIYPYFLITKVNKNLKKIDLECYQLHNLSQFMDDDDPVGRIRDLPRPEPTQEGIA